MPAIYPRSANQDLLPLPTRRSSDLENQAVHAVRHVHADRRGRAVIDIQALVQRLERELRDRKSTRLNSSHVKISYAVFCLKKNALHHESANAVTTDIAAGP